MLSILLIDVIVIIIARFTGLFGSVINIWYDKFGLNAVLADVLIIFLGFLVARWIYTKYLKPWKRFLSIERSISLLIQNMRFLTMNGGEPRLRNY